MTQNDDEMHPLVDVTELTPDTAKKTYIGTVTFTWKDGSKNVCPNSLIEIGKVVRDE